MAIYTGGMRQKEEARKAAKNIAAQQRKAQAGETKRKGRAGIFGKIGGTLLGAGAVGLMGLTGGLAAPLVMGAATSLGKKWADEASQKGFFKTPGQVGKITADNKYGYGKEEAAEATRALRESRKSTWSAESMLGDIAGSYVTAGLSGGLSGAGTKLMSGKEGSFMEAITGSAAGQRKFGWEGVKRQFGTMLGGEADAPEDDWADFLSEEDVSYGYAHPQQVTAAPVEVSQERGIPFMQQQEEDESWIPGFQQGGQVPQLDQNTLVGLAILSQMQQQQQTAYSNTPLDNLSTGSTKKEKQHTSISDYFASQGKTLGGNNTQSLSQMLGRS